jgi:hypothetical protein
MKKLSHLFAAAALCGASSAFAVALPTSGTCGFTMGANFPFVSSQSTGDVSLNFMGTLNFTTKTFKINEVSQVFNSAKTDATRFVNVQNINSITYTTATEKSDMPGMYTIALNATNSLNLLPVNNGKTILMQWFGVNDSQGSMGVCQF